ncbi:MAG TPA: hypothetical protein VN873_01955 [Candidatus Angelobacter sp.]|nr:hypothetical protein [Candidatus Angelobacter sp.]
MGLLNLFAKPRPALQRLPSGSMTVDRDGNIVTRTVTSTYPEEILHQIADEVLRLFQEARKAHLPLSEFRIHYASLHITAREARGGAIIFLAPAVQL